MLPLPPGLSSSSSNGNCDKCRLYEIEKQALLEHIKILQSSNQILKSGDT
jgi:hypothetical protein